MEREKVLMSKLYPHGLLLTEGTRIRWTSLFQVARLQPADESAEFEGHECGISGE